MKTKTGRICVPAVIAAALILCLGFQAPVLAGGGKRQIKRHERVATIDRDSQNTSLPAPVVDDAPIDPTSAEVKPIGDSSGRRDARKPPRKERERRHE